MIRYMSIGRGLIWHGLVWFGLSLLFGIWYDWENMRDTLGGSESLYTHYKPFQEKCIASFNSAIDMDIALFSPSSLFAADDDSSDGETTETGQSFVERSHQFPGIELQIREFGFHQLNANLLWPGTFAFADWLVQHRHLIERRRCLEIGSGTGALAIFLKKEFNLDITTSDYNDQEIEDNIVHNCIANKISPSLPHIKHTWGDEFPNSEPDWDLIIASDILLYVKQYPNLIKSLTFLLKTYKPTNVVSPIESKLNGAETELPWPVFLMSWRRRIGKDDENLFFTGCEEAGLEVKHLGNRVYCIKLRENNC